MEKIRNKKKMVASDYRHGVLMDLWKMIFANLFKTWRSETHMMLTS